MTKKKTRAEKRQTEESSHEEELSHGAPDPDARARSDSRREDLTHGDEGIDDPPRQGS